MKVKSYFKEGDQLITKVKTETIKDNPRLENFSAINCFCGYKAEVLVKLCLYFAK